MWDLSPLTRDQIGVPCIRWWILNYQTTREAPLIDFRHFKYSFSSLSFDICPTVSSIKRNLIWMLLNAPFFCLISFLWFAWEVFSFVVAGVIDGINHPEGHGGGTRISQCPELSDLTPWSSFESRRPGDPFSRWAQFSQGHYITLCEAGAEEIGWESQTAHHREHPWD